MNRHFAAQQSSRAGYPSPDHHLADLGPFQLALKLGLPEHGSWHVAPSTVYRLLRRSGLQTGWERLAVLEAHSAQAAGHLTEGTRRQRIAAQRCQGPTCKRPSRGNRCVWTPSSSGKLKGVGKDWLYTACDAACSYGVAQVSLEFSAAATAHFLSPRVVLAVQKAGWQIQRVLSDQGNEFRRRFLTRTSQMQVVLDRSL